jgi:hypothetical protein
MARRSCLGSGVTGFEPLAAVFMAAVFIVSLGFIVISAAFPI